MISVLDYQARDFRIESRFGQQIFNADTTLKAPHQIQEKATGKQPSEQYPTVEIEYDEEEE